MTLISERAPAEEGEARATGDLLVGLVPRPGTVRILNGDVVVASTDRAIELHEVDVPVRIYIPRADVVLEELRPLEQVSFCPFKGVASDYWALAGDEEGTPVAWSYPEPISAFAGIAGHVAFYDTLTVEATA